MQWDLRETTCDGANVYLAKETISIKDQEFIKSMPKGEQPMQRQTTVLCNNRLDLPKAQPNNVSVNQSIFSNL